MQIRVSATADDVAADAARTIAEQLTEQAGPATFGLAGGSTPVATYRRLREAPVPWERVTCWLSDERWVPFAHPDSNRAMARRELTDHVPTTFLGPDTSLPDPEAAAAAYERVLLPALDRAGHPMPDVVLLGMGPDGHTASLFSGTSALDSDETGYVANWVPAQDTWRLTATASLLRAARHLIFVATGESKAAMLRRILVDGEPLPAGLVAAGAADVTWLLDAAAAADLD